MFQLQGPDEKLDWHQDWSTWIESGDAIDESTWAISPEGPTLSGAVIDGDITTTFVENLLLGMSYQLTNTITTDEGRIGVREITIRCQKA